MARKAEYKDPLQDARKFLHGHRTDLNPMTRVIRYCGFRTVTGDLGDNGAVVNRWAHVRLSKRGGIHKVKILAQSPKTITVSWSPVNPPVTHLKSELEVLSIEP